MERHLISTAYPSEQFNELKNNNIFAEAFLDSNRSSPPTLNELIKASLINYDFGIDGYTFTTHKQHIEDLSALINQDIDNKKILLKVRGRANPSILMHKKNFQIMISNLFKHRS